MKIILVIILILIWGSYFIFLEIIRRLFLEVSEGGFFKTPVIIINISVVIIAFMLCLTFI